MKRISTSTAANGRFVDGNKSTGRKATQFSADWCNQIQEELANLLELNGVSLNGGERQLYDLISNMFGRAKEIQLLTDSGTGDQHTITSADIVEAFKAGRIPVVVSGGGESGVLTRFYFFPKKIYYNDNSTLEINRDCEFYCFGGDSNGHKVLTWKRYYHIPGQGEKYSETVIDLTYPESWQTDELKVGTRWIVKKVPVSESPDTFTIGYLDDSNNFVSCFTIRGQDNLVTFGQNAIATDSWQVQETATVLTVKTNEASPKPFLTFYKTNEYTDFNRVYIGSKNVEFISGPTDIGSLYGGYPKNTILTLVNETSSDKNVTIYGSGQGAEVETIPSHSARQYVKGSSRWYPIYAKDPS